jgi:DNA polymerase-3 subunit gamma/tau
VELAGAVLDGRVQDALRILQDLTDKGKDLGRLLSDLLNHFRNLLIYQVSQGDLSLLEISESEALQLKTQSKQATAEGFTRILEVFADAEMRLRDAASKKILVEVALLKSIEARNAVSVDAVLKQLQAMRETGGSNTPASAATAPTPSPATAAAPPRRIQTQTTVAAAAPTPPASTEPTQLQESSQPAADIASEPPKDLVTLWAALVESVGRASLFTRTYLLEAHPVSLSDKLLTIGFDPEVEDHIGLIDNAKNHALLQTKLSELGYPDAKVKFIKAVNPARTGLAQTSPATPAPQPAPTPKAPAQKPPPVAAATPAKDKPAPVSFSKDDFKNDALIQKALEIFKGQIVEVRA